MMQRFMNLLFPEKCVLCGRLLKKEELDLCHRCRVEAPDCPISGNKLPFIDSWAAVWYYEDAARKSVLRYKFGGRRSYAIAYGRLLAMKLQREYPEGFDLLTYVPTGRWRKWKRGYDQVELLAKEVGQQLGIEPKPLLKKVRRTRVQSRIRGEARRRANVLGAYAVTEPEQGKGKRILLLDDIITTGSTLGECARVLLTAGAKEVHCGAVAKARHRKNK